jgi:C-terminal processing protease CtpA/Prc
MVRPAKEWRRGMTRLLALALVAFVAVVGWASSGRADMPPPYDPYGIGARLEEGKPFPRLTDFHKNRPADEAGLKKGDAVIAIDGSYSAAGRVPFYFFARGMQGPRNSMVELVILRDDQRVFTVKIARTVALKKNW